MAGEPVDDLIDPIPESEVIADPPAKDPPADPPVEDKAGKKVDPPPPAEKPAKRDVPLATFLEEKRKFTEALQTERAEREKLQKQLEALVNPPKAKPKFAEDPEGHIEHSTKESAKEVLAKLEETNKNIAEIKAKTEEDKQRDAHNQFLEELASAEDRFVQTQPDYPNALAHVRKLAYGQMKEFYPDATDEQIMQAITQQEIQMARRAVADGRNPHELAYRLAIVNGYVKAPPKDPKAEAGKKGAPPINPDTVLDPDLSLGKSSGESPGGDQEELFDPEKGDVFDDAIKEMFGRKRA